MRNRKPILTQPERPSDANATKLRLDSRTVVTVRSEKAMTFWKSRYPNATIIG